MLEKYRFGAFAVNELLAAFLAVCIFTGVLVAGCLSGLQISKREFETEAQNIAAVLRGGVGVADGVITSLDAGYALSEQSNKQLNAHLASVLGSYEYVSGLGRFEGIRSDQLVAFDQRLTDIESGTDGAWSYALDGDIVKASSVAARSQYYPLSIFKSRYESSQNDTLLTGFDLASIASTRKAASVTSIGKTVIASVPDVWQRSGDLLIFRSSRVEGSLNRGYLLELDLDEMASSGGVAIEGFNIDLSMFSEQGEFASADQSESLYQQSALVTKDLMFGDFFDDNRWLKSFSFGDKTLVLEVSSSTGLPKKLVVFTFLVAVVLLLTFLTIAQLIRKRRHALKLQKIESEKLHRTRHRAAVTLASIDDGVLTTDVDNSVLSANEAAEKLLGYSELEMQGKDIDAVVVHGKNENSDEGLTLRSADGSTRYVNKKESPLKDMEGEISGHVLVLRDVSVEHSLTQELQHKVNHDSLTGLSNRFNFECQVQELFDATEIRKEGHVLCFIDLDRFKEVNDTCGHDAGDELLKRISTAFVNNVREDDLVARLGGDEFGIVLRNCEHEFAIQITNRIREFFQSFFFEYDGHIFPVRCSIGFVHFHPEQCTSEDVIKAADAACFDAKNQGRNSVCERSSGESTKKSDQGSQWLPKLKAALENEQFHLLAQSVVSLTDGTMSTHEVLLRLVDDDGSMISPSVFMKSAVRYELAESIDRWVVQTALEQMSTLHPDFANDQFAINLSSQSIESSEFYEYLVEQIQSSGIDPSRLCFDIKENDLLSNPAGSEEFCRALREIGCDVALDDFGAAMTSFALLKSLPLTALKIDGSLIANLGLDTDGSEFNADQALVRSIHSFASSMGLVTIAEQVEDAKCLVALKSLNVDYAQGKAVAERHSLSALDANNYDAGSDSRAA